MVVLNIRCAHTRIGARRLRCEADELLQLSHVGIVLGSCHTFNFLGTIRNGRHEFVGVADFGIRYVLVLEVDGIGRSLLRIALTWQLCVR